MGNILAGRFDYECGCSLEEAWLQEELLCTLWCLLFAPEKNQGVNVVTLKLSSYMTSHNFQLTWY